MATSAANASLYSILSVDTNASGESVRKAYRKLVLKCHPDKVRDPALKPDAEALFQKIVTAYEVLSDELKRQEYDKKQKLNGADVDDVLVNVTLKEALTGATKLAMVLDKKKCAACVGVGMRCESCSKCGGRRVDGNSKECPKCSGRGFGAPTPCDTCKSEGKVEDFFQGRVVVPAGVADGSRVQVTGKTQHAKIKIMPSKMFQREGVTIKSTLILTATQAREGGFFDVETIGGTETVFLDSAVATGDVKTLEGKGLPLPGYEDLKTDDVKRGDHVVRIEVSGGLGVEGGDDMAGGDSAAMLGTAYDANDGRPAKRAKTTDEATHKTEPASSAVPEKVDLAVLLAAKKAALLAALEAKTGGA